MCAIDGVYGHPEAANLAYLGLYAMLHRGQEGTGISAVDGKKVRTKKGVGLASSFFNKKRLAHLRGAMAVGHNRYSTTGGTGAKNTQPIVVSSPGGRIAVVHNGNLVRTVEARRSLESVGVKFNTDSDTEILARLIAASKRPTLLDKVTEAIGKIEGAYSMLVMDRTDLVAVRDSHGFRPLVLGKLKSGGYMVASETCALDIVEAVYIREMVPGEVLHLSAADGILRSYYPKIGIKPRR